MRRLEKPDPVRVRAGEGAARVTEELALDQRVRDRAEVVRNERTRGARRERVERPRDQLLSGAGLSLDQHDGVASRQRLDALAKSPEPGALPHEPQ